MSDIAIKVEGLTKKYQLGTQKSGSFRESFSNWFSSGPPDPSKSEFDALADISFEVRQGQAIGIIGRNGAGKSTLLKILSRITSPTHGRIEMYGRIASLLEVGTGFHPELTGRENIYLNGTILGMTRREVQSKFDEIVDFSGVEKFIDTPVKRYSSGMYVRLAFAVAAHLEPEILIIDEVLAVGDAEFQKKCLGKMSEVAGAGRTVIFVSHNMGAVKRLCNQGIVLNQGKLMIQDTVDNCIAAYTQVKQQLVAQNIADRTDRTGTGEIVFIGVDLLSNGSVKDIYSSGQEFELVFHLKKVNNQSPKKCLVWFQVMKDFEVFFTGNSQLFQNLDLATQDCKVSCKIPRLPLFTGSYQIRIFTMVDGRRSDYLENALEFQVEDNQFFASGQTPTEKDGILIDQLWKEF